MEDDIFGLLSGVLKKVNKILVTNNEAVANEEIENGPVNDDKASHGESEHNNSTK